MSSKDGRFTKETASAAGKIGGRKHSKEHMAEIGSVGGSKPKRHRCPECNTLTWARYCSGKCSLKAREKESGR
jgi:general stress protein YciG